MTVSALKRSGLGWYKRFNSSKLKQVQMTSASKTTDRRKLLSILLSMQCSVTMALLLPGASIATPAGATANGSNAMALYQKRDYKNAAAAFYAKLKANPYDNESRYYLANCYAQLKNYKVALEEYQKVSNFAGSSNVGVYSRNAIDSINQMLHPGEKSSAGRPGKPGDTKVGDDGEKVDVVAKKDPKIAAAEAAEKAKLDEGDKAAKKIMDEAQNRCKSIKQREDEAVLEVSNNQSARMQNPDLASVIINDTKAPFEEEMKNIMEPAKRRADEIKAQAKRDADRIKQEMMSRR
jgi:hypothetical protein